MPRLGSGKRFASGKAALMRKGMSAKSAGAVMAARGRKRYGKTRFQKMAAVGKRRAARKRKR